MREDFELSYNLLGKAAEVNHTMMKPAERLRMAHLSYGAAFTAESRLNLLAMMDVHLAGRRERLAVLASKIAG